MNIKLGIFILLVVVSVQGKKKDGPDRTPHNIQTVIKLLLGKICNCNCGDPNFPIEEYRQAEEIENLKDSSSGSAIESMTQSTLESDSNPKQNGKNAGDQEKKEIEDPYNEEDDSKNDDDNEIDEDAALAKLLLGDRLRENGLPWSALVIINDRQAVSPITLFAGGAIITDKHVITSASALIGATADEIKVYVGAHDICNPVVTGMNVSVSEVQIHPSYLVTDKRHDIAILTLSSKLILNRNISLVCLPPYAYSNILKTAWVASWLGNPPPPGLPLPACTPKVLRLPIMTLDECNRAANAPVTYEKGCLGAFGGPGLVCAGDRGAPVLIINKRKKFELFGIMMDTSICTSPYPAQFIRVDLHVDWIFSKIGSGCICKY